MSLNAIIALNHACRGTDMSLISQLLRKHHYDKETLANAATVATGQNNNIQILEILLEAGWNGSHPDGEGILYMTDHDDIVRWLFRHGVDPNMPAEQGALPVAIAAFYAPISVLTLLLDYGVRLEGSGALSAAATS